MKDGVIADFDASEKMISMFIKEIPALKKKWFAPSLRMVICIPSYNRGGNASGKG
ncbi:rod shape-determining protein MreB [Nonlabens ulvanivorans]|nr:rod shape-determining protein MreB [Nonlabens ulvanivorans]